MDTRKLELKRRTKEFAGRIVRLYVALPIRRAEVSVLGRQLLRSGTSVAANYREASRARSRNEFIAKVELCSQEADELIAIFVTMARRTKEKSET
jgi:four helix bundle protein